VGVAVDLGVVKRISLLLIFLFIGIFPFNCESSENISAGKKLSSININYSMPWNGIHIGINSKSINMGLVF
jgi:hypothetical protein|tara:strand:+ start:46 stop:258 length:213 start_codon:yes stop_codon:yes gene_type:complete